MLNDEESASLGSSPVSVLRRGPRQSDVITVCLLVLVFIAVVIFLEKFQSLLVPLTFAVFFAQLFEPILAVLVRGPRLCISTVHSLMMRRLCALRRPRERTDIQSDSGRDVASGDTRRDAAALLTSDVLSADRAEAAAPPDAGGRLVFSTQVTEELQAAMRNLSKNGHPKRACDRLVNWIQRTWEIISVVFCTGLLLGTVSSLVWAIVAALESFDWSKYQHSARMKQLLHLMESVGISVRNLDGSYVMNNFRSQIMDALSGLLNFSEGMVLTLLMFFFCLLAFVTRIHDPRGQQPPHMKRLVQQYLLWKTVVSLIIGAVVGMALKLLKVDLAELFGVLTCILNFIPNLGSFFATIAPVPLAALDPEKDLNQVALVLIVPFLIHNTLGCIIEPKVMAGGLDLHPLTIVVALTFWGSVWGIAGAILSIPVTSVIRLWLKELDHPYAKAVYDLFNPASSRTSKSAAAAASAHMDSWLGSWQATRTLERRVSLETGAVASEDERLSAGVGTAIW